MSGIYYTQQKISRSELSLISNKDELLNHVKLNNIKMLSQHIEENTKHEISDYDFQYQEETHLFSVAIISVDEYKELKAIEKEYKRLLGGKING